MSLTRSWKCHQHQQLPVLSVNLPLQHASTWVSVKGRRNPDYSCLWEKQQWCQTVAKSDDIRDGAQPGARADNSEYLLRCFGLGSWLEKSVLSMAAWAMQELSSSEKKNFLLPKERTLLSERSSASVFLSPRTEGSEAEGEKWTRAWVKWSGQGELFQNYFYHLGIHLFLECHCCECGSLLIFFREERGIQMQDIHKGLGTAPHSKNTQAKSSWTRARLANPLAPEAMGREMSLGNVIVL